MSKPMIKPIKIVEVKSEIGAGTRGASMGIDAIKIAALDFGSPFFKRFKTVEIPSENHLLLEPVVNDYAKRIKGIFNLNERLAKEISSIMPFFMIFQSGAKNFYKFCPLKLFGKIVYYIFSHPFPVFCAYTGPEVPIIDEIFLRFFGR